MAADQPQSYASIYYMRRESPFMSPLSATMSSRPPAEEEDESRGSREGRKEGDVWPHLGRGGEEAGRSEGGHRVRCHLWETKRQKAKGASFLRRTRSRARRARWDGSLEPQAPAAAPQRKVARLLSVFSVYWQLHVSTGIGICGRGQEKAFIHARALAPSHCLPSSHSLTG